MRRSDTDGSVDSSGHAAPEISPRASSAEPDVPQLAWGLGQREREVLSVVLAQGGANVQQVADLLSTALAYTTVMTTLDRLFKKGLLRREKKDRAFIYSSSFSAIELEERRAGALVRGFFSGSTERPEILLSCLVDAVHHYDTGMLDKLEAKIRLAKERREATLSEPTGGS